jgi:ribonuclease Z
MSPGTIVAPANLIPAMREILAAWGQLDGNKIPAKLVGVRPGDEYQIKPNLFARVFPTKHSPGSVGFCVLEKRKKLKPEFVGLSGPQLVELKKQGTEIDYPVEMPIVSYLGDTQYVDFCQLPYVTTSKILIAECTFYEEEHAVRAEAGRHMHINELAHLLSCMQNEHIIITHTTQRTPITEVRRVLEESLPPEVYSKLILLMDRRSRRSGHSQAK